MWLVLLAVILLQLKSCNTGRVLTFESVHVVKYYNVAIQIKVSEKNVVPCGTVSYVVRGTQTRFPSKYIENTFQAIQSTFRSLEMHSKWAAL